MAISVVTTGTSTSGALGFTATAGRLVVCVLGVRNWNVTWNSGGGWTLLQKWDNNINGAEPPIFLFAKVAAGGETAIGGSFNNDAGRAACSIEVTGATLTGNGGTATRDSSGFTSPTIPSITPPAGASCLIVGGADHTQNISGTPGAPYSSLGPVLQSGNQWPFMVMSYQVVTSASGSYSASISGSGGIWAAANAYILANAVPVSARAVIV